MLTRLLFALLVGALITGSSGCSAQNHDFNKRHYKVNQKSRHIAENKEQFKLEKMFIQDNLTDFPVITARSFMQYVYVPVQENGGGGYFTESGDQLANYYANKYLTPAIVYNDVNIVKPPVSYEATVQRIDTEISQAKRNWEDAVAKYRRWQRKY